MDLRSIIEELADQFLREELVMEQESHNAARRVIADMYSRAEEYYNA